MKEDIFTKPYPSRPKGGNMAAPKTSTGIPATAKTEEPIKIKPSPYIPPMAYIGDPAIPGYWLEDIKLLLHKDDYRDLLKQDITVFDEGGRKKIWALDYIRWLNGEHED